MGFEVGRINHQPAVFPRCFCQLGKDVVEDTQTAPAHKTIIQGFVRPILTGSVFPLQAVLNDINDAADNFQVIDT